MSCFSCMSPRLKEGNARIKGLPPVSRHTLDSPTPTNLRSGKRKMSFDASEKKSMLSDIDEKLDDIVGGSDNVSKTGKSFLFRELLAAVGSFKDSNMVGEGGFGKVYKGTLDGQAVAIKQLNRDGLQGNQEFIVEVLMLSLLHHPNLVNLVGYCAEGDQRLLVYEYMPMGNLGNHLFDPHPSQEPLGWNTRIKIAVGAARGLEYLHVKANPPVIYRDLKSANILLDNDFNPKLSDFGLAKLGPVGDKTHVSTRVMGTYGYCAPEYAMSGKLTVRSDVYCFGVVLLELITGRMALDSSRKAGEQNLVAWSRPYLKDRRKLPAIADPLLKGCYPVRCFYHLVAIAATCLQEQPTFRPVMREVVAALEYLQSQPYKPETGNGRQTPPQSPVKEAGLFHQEVDNRISSVSL